MLYPNKEIPVLKIRQLQKSEINLLSGFPPEEWKLDLSGFVSFHFGYSYFYPIVAEVDNKLAGFAQGILNGKTGWLGNIIVLPEYRRQGIGYELTIHLVEYFKGKGCKTQLLIASEMGKNIYKKLGFNESSSYYFLRDGSNFQFYKRNNKIRKIVRSDFSLIKKLDEEITSEERYDFIKRFFNTGCVYKEEGSNEIEGFFLPNLGGGLINAKSSEAGLELLKFKLSLQKTKAVIPSENKIALDFLEKEGYNIYLKVPRMVLGNELNWKPECIFNRATGYCG